MGTFLNISSLDKDQLANIHGHFWKERLIIRKPIAVKASEDIKPLSREMLQTFQTRIQSSLTP